MKKYSEFDYRSRQSGLGATVILFTIALLILVGAALAYANRGTAGSINVQGGKVYSAVLLKQSADYRDAYSRFIFDSGTAPTSFNAPNLPAGNLFDPAKQYGLYQAPPPQSLTIGATPAWLYNSNVLVKGVGTDTGPEVVTYVSNLTQSVCQQINNQMYGTTAVPVATIASGALGTGGTSFDTSPTVGRSTGCFATTDTIYVFYSTLAET